MQRDGAEQPVPSHRSSALWSRPRTFRRSRGLAQQVRGRGALREHRGVRALGPRLHGRRAVRRAWSPKAVQELRTP